MTRESCLKCVKKHIAQAIILMSEEEIGYTSHRWLAVGHLSEAENESSSEFPDVATKIRIYKKQVEKGNNPIMLPLIEYILREHEQQEIKETNSVISLLPQGFKKLVEGDLDAGR